MPGLPPQISDNSVTLTFGANHVYYGYCTVADVQFEFPNKASYSTLDSSTIAQEITYAGTELQKQIEHAYLMPYTGTDGGILLTLRNWNAWLAFANLVERYFSGGEPNLSPAAGERRNKVEAQVLDLFHGTVRWDTPFGDATPNAMMPVYNLAKGALITPNPGDIDQLNANPVFSMGLSRYRKTDIL